MGATRWIESCLCTSSEGAGESSYIMAKLLEEQEWKCYPSSLRCSFFVVVLFCFLHALTLSCTAGTSKLSRLQNIDSLLICVNSQLPSDFLIVLDAKGRRKYNVDSCKSSFGPVGENVLYSKAIRIRTQEHYFLNTPIFECQNVLRQFLEIAAHFFVVYFDVAALLILVLLNKSWIAACGPFYSLKT